MLEFCLKYAQFHSVMVRVDFILVLIASCHCFPTAVYFLCRKNVVYNFTEAEVKVREATSNDPWGPPSTLMAELAEMTYSV